MNTSIRKTFSRLRPLACALAFAAATCWTYSADVDETKLEGGDVEGGRTAREMAEEFIASKGMQEGSNTRPDGSKYFVAIASGEISAPIDHANYIVARSNAFTKAMMGAWGDIRRFVSTEVAASASSFYTENAAGINAGNAKDPRTAALLEKAMAETMQQKGIDPAKATQSDKDKILNMEEFSTKVSAVAAGRVSGVQAMSVFEGKGGGKGYSIVVVAVWSEKLQRMAESLIAGGSIEDGKSGKKLAEWMPADDALLSTFGVQLVYDENCKAALIAYGQSTPVSESTRSVDAAFSKAQLEAMASLRFFAGAMVKVADDQEKAESMREYGDKTKSYEAENSFTQAADVYAPPQKFSGISVLKRKQLRHPITKAVVTVTVIRWTPADALFAGKMGKAMARVPKPQGGPDGQDGTAAETASRNRRSLDDHDKGVTKQGAAGSDDF